jgi:hypothetical protein
MHQLKKDANGRFYDNTDNLKKWLGNNIDKRVGTVLGLMKLATRQEVTDLTTTIESLNQKIEKLERLQAEKARKLEKEVHQKAVASMAQ